MPICKYNFFTDKMMNVTDTGHTQQIKGHAHEFIDSIKWTIQL